MRVSIRNRYLPSYSYYIIGFRCAQDYNGDIPDSFSLIEAEGIEPFLMAKHQVTQKLWLDTMGSNPSCFRPKEEEKGEEG